MDKCRRARAIVKKREAEAKGEKKEDERGVGK
jgi:hypothetical protein